MTQENERRTEREGTGGVDARGSGVSAADWIVSEGESIQSAVESASTGDVIGIEPGTFTEQVVVDTWVTIVGTGQGETTIRSPPSLSARFDREGDEFRPVVSVESQGAKLWDLTVDGDRQGSGNEAFVGIGGRDTNLSLGNVRVTRITEDPVNGARHGFGVFVYNGDGAERHVQVEGCDVHGYQRGGVVGDGDGLSIYVEDSTITGSDSAAAVRQNGIQVSDAQRATVVGNSITDNYHARTVLASGVAVLRSSDVFVAWNSIERNDVGVTIQGAGDVLVRRNNIQSNGVGLLNLGGEPFDATNNWWGSTDGPSVRTTGEDVPGPGSTEGADGNGDAVYNVVWEPYSDRRFDLGPSGTDRRERRGAISTDERRSHGRTDQI